VTRQVAAALLALLFVGGAATPAHTHPMEVTHTSGDVCGPQWVCAGSGAVRPVAATEPGPPPLRVAAPSGARPGPAAGLRAPERCTPPEADTAPVSADSGAKRMQLPAVHRLATGAGQVVAVIDTGVAAHPRLGSRLRGGGDFLTGGDGRADCDGHGTAVAGIIAASVSGRDGGGVEGIAPDATVLAIRQSSPSFEVPDGDGALRPAGDVRTLAEAIVLAVRSGAKVINISEAVCLPAAQAGVQGASIQAALRLAARSDVVVVAAAGNAGVGSCAPAGQEPADQVALPGWYGDDILAVGAVDSDDAPAEFTVPGPWVDVAAPGTGLRSLAVGGGTTGTGVDGTSFAAPWVSGLAALLRERFPRLTAAEVVDRILATARRPSGGQSAPLGRGVIDPMAALTAVPDVLSPTPPLHEVRVPLPGTAPRPVTTSDDIPVEQAAGALIAIVAAAAWLLRRRPARRP
jgi:membrane-anchored mycosin MYCP